MKKLTSLLALAATATAVALTPGTPQQIATAGQGAFHPVLSPDGSTLLFSSLDHTGLNALDLNTDKVTVLDASAAAGFCPIFSTDSKTVVYRTAQIVDGLMYRDVRTVDIAGKKRSVVRKMSREDVNINVEAGHLSYVAATLDGIHIVGNGAEKVISPVEDAHSYLWASVSPDGQHLLFVEPFKGVFVCNLDGSNLKRVSDKGDYPCWISNDAVAFVLTRDDGYVTLSSQLIAADLTDGSFVTITDADTLVGELTAAPGRVVYSTVEGKLYTLTIK